MSRRPSRRCLRASGIGHRGRHQAGSGGSWPRCIVETWRSYLSNSAKSPPPRRTCRKACLVTADSGREERYAMTCPWRHKHNPLHRKVRYRGMMIEGFTLMSTTTAVALDPNKLYEIVDGQPAEKEMPGARHSGICGR